jgi:hypothetical protein
VAALSYGAKPGNIENKLGYPKELGGWNLGGYVEKCYCCLCAFTEN